MLSPAAREFRTAYLFLLPAALLLVVFHILPTVAALFVSFTRYPILRPPEWNGGENYLTIFANPSFRRSILNTALYSVYFIPTKIVLAFLVATAITRSSARLSGVFLVAYYVPRMTSMVVASFIWLWLYQPDNGPLSAVMQAIGLDRVQWIYAIETVLPSVAAVSVWKDFGHTTVLLVAGLLAVPKELREAATIDGANAWQTFWRVVVPVLKPVILLVVIKTFIESFRAFTQIFVMTRGGPADASTTVVHQIYVTGFEYLRLGEASAMSFLLLISLLVVFVPYYRMLRQEAGI